MNTKYTNYTEILGLVLREFRYEVQYSKKDMCSLLHVSEQRLSDIEFGAESITFASAELYVQQTGHTLRQLLDKADVICNTLNSKGVSLNLDPHAPPADRAQVTGSDLWAMAGVMRG